MNVTPFDQTQRELIKRGVELTDIFSEKIIQALGKANLKHVPKRNSYFAGPSGVGKSWTVTRTAAKYGVDLIHVTGDSTISNLAIRLAVNAYLSKGKELFIWIDDCDSLFRNSTSIAVMKGALDKDRYEFAWNRSLTGQIQMYHNSDNAQHHIISSALEKYQPVGNTGVVIPTDKMRFIVTSNHKLPPLSGEQTVPLKKDQAALRSRFAYNEINLSEGEKWGWMATYVLTNKVITLTIAQKHTLLLWLYEHWARLPDNDLRTIEELAAELLNFPSNYVKHWESRLTPIR